MYQDGNSSSLSLMAIAIESYDSAPDSLKTREMLRLTYKRMKEDCRLTIVEPDTTDTVAQKDGFSNGGAG